VADDYAEPKTFSQNQTIAVGVQRANLRRNHYPCRGSYISLFQRGRPGGCTGRNELLRAAQHKYTGVLTVTPAVISFLALDGGSNPTERDLVISNPMRFPGH